LEDMQSHLGDLLLSNEGADITFAVGGKHNFLHTCACLQPDPAFSKNSSLVAILWQRRIL
jgi:hypothetical protein